MDMRQYDFPQPHRLKQMEVLKPTLVCARVQRFERRRARRFDLSDLLRGLHAEPPVLREQRHNARDGAHRAGEERARARVGGEVHAALLQVAHLVSCAIDLARETHNEAVGAPDGRLEQERARHACARADEVQREPDEGEPIRCAAEGSPVGAARDADQLRLDTCNKCALWEVAKSRS